MLDGIWLKLGPIFSVALKEAYSSEYADKRAPLVQEIINALEARDPVRAQEAVGAAVDSSTEAVLALVPKHGGLLEIPG